MNHTTYPGANETHRKADMAVHLVGLTLILIAGGILLTKASATLEPKLIIATAVYILCALISNLASIVYHFSKWHAHRELLRRIDHAAIYPSIAGTFTPFFALANTTWTITLLCICWGLAVIAIINKITNETVKSRWSTASYLALGAIGLGALPDLTEVPVETLWCIIAGAACYVIGTAFYARKSMPFRYASWHTCVNFGGIAMFASIWIALF
tara:strand:+ start:443 stop:1081 length:639 start_codon:yes stop_codon:yes gene_type:complete